MAAKVKTKLNIGERRRKVVAFILLTIISILCVLPLLWAFGTSFKKNALTDVMSIIPREFSFNNYIQLFSNEDAPVFRWMLNSVVISGVHTLLYIVIAALAGFAFGVAEWKGRNVVFGLLLATAMVPNVINLVPLYKLITSMELNGNPLALILPGLGGVLYMMLIRQYFMSVPKELVEAAQLEGAGMFRIFLQIEVPLCKSAFMVAAMMTFIGSWNDYLWPSIAMAGVSTENLTLPLGIAKLLGDNNIQYGMTMAGAVVSMLPTLIVYLFLQNKVIESVANSGSKS
ncbi:MAG TPA: carbohydrate ABC transporter permease [Candidatus Scatosoma pullicola]|nr:carbohydrate ABC transporter permease [Candidatus Scatosoma pullicola]